MEAQNMARRNKLIFQILAGKKLEEITQHRQSYMYKEAETFSRCISQVYIEEGLRQEEIEEELIKNYYVAQRAYKYIITHYFDKNKVEVYFKRNDQLKFEATQKRGKVFIYVPDLSDDSFDSF